jgi:flagellar hook protein FlgE
MASFGIPLSGLIASQDQLQSISSNLANLSTDGYKDQNDTFSDIFAISGAANGAQDPLQTGLGAQLAETTSDFTTGSLTSTGIASNMAISGNGFFLSKQADGSLKYIRAGDFTTSSTGYLVDPAGGQILGYPATNGVVNAASTPVPLQLGTSTISPATSTTTFTTSTNLSSQAVVGTTSGTYPGTFNATQISVYDSLGNVHTLSPTFVKTGTNTWSYTLNVPTADTGLSTTVVDSGVLTFSSTGALSSITSTGTGTTVSGTTSVSGITIPLTDGASSMSVTWNLLDASGNPTLTQTNVSSATTVDTQNGNASGTLINYVVNSDGTVEGSFTNGKTAALGQVALANFVNPEGLQRTGSNYYSATIGSGPALVGTAGTGGRGTLTGGYVEGSNVNTASEFSKLIVAQQNYQANAKTITSFDQISQATIAMLPS